MRDQMADDIDSWSSPYKAVVFDMDGLIFNSEDLYDLAGERLLRRHGKQFTRDLKLAIMGKKAPQAIELLCELAELTAAPADVQRELQEYFIESIEGRLETMPGFNSLLGKLAQRRMRCAIATSSSRHLAEAMLDCFQLQSRFEFLLTGDEVRQGKPHPEIYLTIAERLQIEPQQMLVLEDSPAGSTAAVAAGAYTVAVPNDHTRECDFSHVQLVADTLADPELERCLWPDQEVLRKQAD